MSIYLWSSYVNGRRGDNGPQWATDVHYEADCLAKRVLYEPNSTRDNLLGTIFENIFFAKRASDRDGVADGPAHGLPAVRPQLLDRGAALPRDARRGRAPALVQPAGRRAVQGSQQLCSTVLYVPLEFGML